MSARTNLVWPHGLERVGPHRLCRFCGFKGCKGIGRQVRPLCRFHAGVLSHVHPVTTLVFADFVGCSHHILQEVVNKEPIIQHVSSIVDEHQQRFQIVNKKVQFFIVTRISSLGARLTQKLLSIANLGECADQQRTDGLIWADGKSLRSMSATNHRVNEEQVRKRDIL